MHTNEHTDLDGDALTVHRDKGLAWVTITRDGDEMTVGPVPVHALTGQHRGSHTRDERRDAESCPLTPDAITDETRERAYRAVAALSVCDWDDMSGVAKGRAMAVVEAVITEITRPEPPARPEGVEAVAVRLAQAGAEVGVHMTAKQRDALADHLVAMRVRVVGEDDGGDETPEVCPHVGGPGGDCGCPL